MHNYSFLVRQKPYTCIKSPAIDCQAFKDRPVDRDRLVGQPCTKK